jgi:flagellar biosynthesis/type III secretory pathway protein FliH
MIVRETDNLCVICGNVIPEGRQACPNCEAQVDASANRIMSKVNDEVEQAFRQGYLTGFNEGMKAACELKQQNEQLRRRIVVLENQARNTVDDIDGEFE